jgi:CRISPR-associated protein Csx10
MTMKHGLITIHFEHYWHCGSGQAGEGDVDLLPVTEPCGLPYTPGRALRGRLKWTARELGWGREKLEHLFGTPDARELESVGKLHVTNATMRDAFAARCRRHFLNANREENKILPEVSALFEDIASTALENGVAQSQSLRRVRYAVPVTLIAEVSLNGDDQLWQELDEIVRRLRAIGKGKHDGFGWCSASLSEVDTSNTPARPQDALAYDLEIELLDDVVFSATSATTGGHRTLDHVSGSSLMGAFARALFSALRIKHRGDTAAAEREGAEVLIGAKVAFGNGVPVSATGRATVPVPLSWHYVKDKSGVENGTIKSEAIHNLAVVNLKESGLKDEQLVQMREGWLDADCGRIITVDRTQTLKTAIDERLAKYETAQETGLFGYEALAKGARFISRIEVKNADPGLCELLREAFDGKIIRLGRSKGTEFGRAKCKLTAAVEDRHQSAAGPLVFLAESDLALLDSNGFPTLEPEPRHFGLDEGWELCQERSYLRFRRYSLWNAKRGGRDVERQVISKGSVLVFTNEQNPNAMASPILRVGVGQCDGLGRVRIAQEWLAKPNPDFNRRGGQRPTPTGASGPILDTNDLTAWIEDRYKEKQFDIRAATIAREWCARWVKAKGKVSPSQWGRLNNAARDLDSVEHLLEAVGDGEEDQAGQKKTIFGHGRLRKKWNDGAKAGGETNPEVRGSLAQEIRKALTSKPDDDDRLTLAAFRAACQRMAADARRKRD